jgi:hypothetical protein
MKCQHGCSGLVQTWLLLAGAASHTVYVPWCCFWNALNILRTFLGALLLSDALTTRTYESADVK